MFKSLKQVFAEIIFGGFGGYFKQDASGRDVWYPYGPGCKGYIVSEREKYQKLEKRLNITFMYATLALPLIVFINATVCVWWAFTVVIWYFLVKRDAVSRLARSGEQLGYIEAIKEEIPTVSIELYGFGLVTIVLIAGRALYRGNLLEATMYLFIASILSFKIFLKWKDLKASSSLPADKKTYIKGGATIILASFLFMSFLYLAIFLIIYSTQFW